MFVLGDSLVITMVGTGIGPTQRLEFIDVMAIVGWLSRNVV